MRENFTYGSVGRAPGNRCLYPEADHKGLRSLVPSLRSVAPELKRSAYKIFHLLVGLNKSSKSYKIMTNNSFKKELSWQRNFRL